jgi:hypothetical protein
MPVQGRLRFPVLLRLTTDAGQFCEPRLRQACCLPVHAQFGPGHKGPRPAQLSASP